MPNKKYTKEALKSAIEEIRNGRISTYRASKIYYIPWQTLDDNIKKKTKYANAGAPTVLSTEEEKLLATEINEMAAAGFPVTKDLLLYSVAKLIKKLRRANKFKDGKPGRHWYEGFLSRNPTVTPIVCQSLTASKVKANEEKIRSWFQKVLSYCNKNGYSDVLKDPSRVFNCDETVLFICPKGQAVLARKEVKTICNNDEKECLTLLLGASAVGKLMPVSCIFPYKRMPKNIKVKYPKNWSVGKTDSGWVTRESFYEYITNVFNPFLVKENIKKPVILFLDGNVSYLSLHLINFCKENGIILVALLANSTHLLQPLDVAIFRVLKSEWSKQVNSWQTTNNGHRLKREDFPCVLENAIKESLTERMISNGFRECGLYPYDENVIDYNSLGKNSETSKINSSISLETPTSPEDICSTSLEIPTSRKDIFEGNDHVEWFQNCLGREKLHTFQQCYGEWNGDVRDENLFYLWMKITSGGCQTMQKSLYPAPMVLGDSTFESNINIDFPNDVNVMDSYQIK